MKVGLCAFLDGHVAQSSEGHRKTHNIPKSVCTGDLTPLVLKIPELMDPTAIDSGYTQKKGLPLGVNYIKKQEAQKGKISSLGDPYGTPGLPKAATRLATLP